MTAWAKRTVTEALRPLPLVSGLIADAFRSREELAAENLLLRQQLIVASRKVKQPKFRPWERGLFVFLASKLRHWRGATLLVKPDGCGSIGVHSRAPKSVRLLIPLEFQEPEGKEPNVSIEFNEELVLTKRARPPCASCSSRTHDPHLLTSASVHSRSPWRASGEDHIATNVD